MVDFVRLFGSPTLLAGDTPVRLPAGIGEVVALLSLEYRQVAERRTLAARLREDAPDGVALNALRQTLLRLRRVESRHGVTVLHAFDAHLARTDDCVPTDLEAFLALGEIVTAADLARLLDLYRGDLLADVDARGDLRTWLDSQRNRLRDRFIALATDGARRIGGALGRAAMERVRDEIGAESVAAAPQPDDIAYPSRGSGVDVPRIAVPRRRRAVVTPSFSEKPGVCSPSQASLPCFASSTKQPRLYRSMRPVVPCGSGTAFSKT